MVQNAAAETECSATGRLDVLSLTIAHSRRLGYRPKPGWRLPATTESRDWACYLPQGNGRRSGAMSVAAMTITAANIPNKIQSRSLA